MSNNQMIKKLIAIVKEFLSLLARAFLLKIFYVTFIIVNETYGKFYAILCVIFLLWLFGGFVEQWREYRLRRYRLMVEEMVNIVNVKMIELAALIHKEEFSELHDELFKYHHKRQFYRKIDKELLPVAWHPDRAVDWCFDEEEKGLLEEMWKN